MAARATLNHFDLLSHDEQAAVEALLEQQPLSEKITTEEKQGWSIRAPLNAFVNHYPIVVPLASNLLHLCKKTYSLVTIKTPRINTGGNFCGHNPAQPRFVMQHHAYFAKQDIDDLGNKRRPQILYDIVETIKAYYDDPDVMPILHTAHYEHRTSDRQRRSEFREAIVNLLSVMIMNMDLGSLRVGQPLASGGFLSYSLEWLAKKAKLSISRAERAMSNINDAMIIASYQYRELIDKEKQQYRAHNAVRVFDLDFFKMLQIDLQKFGKARKLAHKKQQDKQAAYRSNCSEKDDAVASLNTKKIMKAIDPQSGTLKSANPPPDEAEKRQANRLHKGRTQVFLEVSNDPRYANDDQAFQQELQRRLAARNLLHDHEKAT